MHTSLTCLPLSITPCACVFWDGLSPFLSWMCRLLWIESVCIWGLAFTWLHVVCSCTLMMVHGGGGGGGNHQLSRAAGDCAFSGKKRGGEEKSAYRLLFPLPSLFSCSVSASSCHSYRKTRNTADSSPEIHKTHSLSPPLPDSNREKANRSIWQDGAESMSAIRQCCPLGVRLNGQLSWD